MHRPMSREPSDARLAGGLALCLLALSLIGWATLRPGSGSYSAGVACCSGFDLALNVLLFLPLGAGLLLAGCRVRTTVILGLLLSSVIELAQWRWIPGRFASPADVLANVAGVGLGILAVSRWERRDRWWPKIAPVIAVTVVFVWLAGGYLAQPAIPGSAPWTAEWTDTTAGEGARVVALAVQGTPLPAGPIAGASNLRARLMASRKTVLDATLVTGARTEGPHRLAEIVVGAGSVPFLVLEQRGDALLAYQRIGLSWVGLRGPWLELKGALGPPGRDTVRVELTATRSEVRLSATRWGGDRSTSYALSPELYPGALFHRASDGALRWRLVPAMLSFMLLGLAMARHPKLLLIAAAVALFVSANRAGSAYPEWPVVLVAALGAWIGRHAGNRLGLFPPVSAVPGSGDRSGQAEDPQEPSPGTPPAQV